MQASSEDGSTLNESIFAAGSDLWLVPEIESSETVQKMDWYLNFQIAKAASHEPATLPSRIQDILKSCALEKYDWAPKGDQSLLILSSQLLPNRWILVLEGSDQLELWAQNAVTKWKNLNCPSVRIFLPRKASAAQFEKLWKKAGGSETAIFIADGK